MATNCSIYDFHDEDSERSTHSDSEKVEKEYLAIKGRLKFSLWSVFEENNKIHVVLDDKELDKFFTDLPEFSFGSVAKVIPVDNKYMQFIGSTGVPIVLALSDFNREKNDQSRVLRTNSVDEFCESIMEEIQFYDGRRPEDVDYSEFNEPVEGECNGIVEKIGKSYLGTCKVPIGRLLSPEEDTAIRDLDYRHVEKIKTSCKVSLSNGGNVSFPRGIGAVKEQCLIEDIRNGSVDVTIVDGNHSTTAMRELAVLFPEVENLKYRMMDIYVGLEDVVIKSLALMRNEESTTAKRTTDFEKVSLMRKELSKYNNLLSTEFINHIYGMFNCLCPSDDKEETLRKKKLLPYIKISTMANETWAIVEDIEKQHQGHNMYVYAPLGRIRSEDGQNLLEKVVRKELKLSAFSKELKRLTPAENGEETALQMLRNAKQKGKKENKKAKGRSSDADDTRTCKNTESSYLQEKLLQKEAEVEKLRQAMDKKEKIFNIEKSKLVETISDLKLRLQESNRIHKDTLLNQKEREIDGKLLEERKLEIERLRAEVQEQNEISTKKAEETEAYRKTIENQKMEIDRLHDKLKERYNKAKITDALPFNVGPPLYHSTPLKGLESDSSVSVLLPSGDSYTDIDESERNATNKRSQEDSNDKNLKRSKRLQEYNEYQEDQKIKAFYKPEKKWYGARILEVKRSGCVIRYDEDGVKETVSFQQIKPANP